MSLKEKHPEFDEDLIRAVDHLMQHLVEEGIRDGEKAGELMVKFMENHDVEVEGDQYPDGEECYTTVSETKLLKAVKTGQKIHNHQLQ